MMKAGVKSLDWPEPALEDQIAYMLAKQWAPDQPRRFIAAGARPSAMETLQWHCVAAF